MFEGATTALITPFNEDGSVDYEGYKKNVQFQIKNGINGLLPLGTTGETPTLNDEEKKKIIELVVSEAKGKVPVLVGTGTNSTDKTIKNTQIAKDLGADAVLIVTPYYNKPTNEGIFRHFEAVNNAVDIPIIVYNIQGRTGRNIDTPTMKRLAALKNVFAVKEASGSIDQMGDVINQIPDLMVLSGDDGLTMPLLSLGGKGVISVVSNILPDKVVQMCKHGLNGDFDKARELHFQLLPVIKGIFIETNPIPVKEAMNLMGLAAGCYRLPMCEMLAENKEKLKQILESSGVL